MHYGFMYYRFDFLYLLLILVAILSIAASAKLNGTFSKYDKVRSACGLTAAEAARRLLDRSGLQEVRIERVPGSLSDHYDMRSQVLRLSDATFQSCSVAALGVAAHECGHAVQGKEGYGPLKLRNALIPAANLGSRLGIPLVLFGFLLGWNSTLIQAGIVIFSAAVLFQVVLLPVEFNASARGLRMLEDYGLLGGSEVQMSKKVLQAAALTYVAAAAASILQLLRLILLSGRRNRD